MNSELIMMVVRKVLTIGGTALVTKGVIGEAWMDPELISGIALLIASVIWSKSNANKLTTAKELVPDLNEGVHAKRDC